MKLTYKNIKNFLPNKYVLPINTALFYAINDEAKIKISLLAYDNKTKIITYSSDDKSISKTDVKDILNNYTRMISYYDFHIEKIFEESKFTLPF